ncbi:hypothetical protein [Actinoplanes couchii]|uniref:Uncharacterized protein n=1 Tax=Actinoplanes couchii TaxID=403638 RepID=A0ABQ3XT75_9ACTN|nr:hypothetical protein [Actinoplanes couchii]MDR6317033.1 hypothetical protein [Actinoplanes couchii]GID61719.1 hypothetical protein Aco03nite_101230 [Actinoplanes couchii]
MGFLAVLMVSGCTAEPESPAGAPASEAPLVFVTPSPAASPAQSFGPGSYLVGRDVELGRYSAGDTVTRCRWLQRDSAGTFLDGNAADRPTQVLTLSAEDSELVVAGDGCSFTRMP